MKPNHASLMLALIMGAVGVDSPGERNTGARTPRRYTDERKAAAAAKQARKQAKRAAAHHGGTRG